MLPPTASGVCTERDDLFFSTAKKIKRIASSSTSNGVTHYMYLGPVISMVTLS